MDLVGFAGRVTRLAAHRPGLVHVRLEVVFAVTERDATLAERHAAIGLALGALVNRHELIGRPFDLNDAIFKDVATAIHRNDVRGSVTLAGHNNNAARLERDVGDQRIADDQRGNATGELEQFRLIDVDRDGFARMGRRNVRDGQ